MPTDKQSFLAELQARLVELARTSPAADLERNVKAILAQAFQRLELVTRDEYEVSVTMLEQLTRRVEALERASAASTSTGDRATPGNAG